ncbi:hypothetical protein L6164_010655 [Bauhinia variegata]|uniref:Uncharacterized protein n=1 Tax=Bauhinia variegata TaxID=167791 RepID=A0ACB9PRD3_BAUVA|nr:hypothetical protein L6164_010655 [Bauhinia variegata]
MARYSTLVTSLPKLGHATATIAKARAWNPTIFAAATPRPIQIPSNSNQDGSVTGDGTKHGASETVNMSENMRDKAYSSTTEHVKHESREMAGKMSAAAQNISENAKQTMQDAWDSSRNTAQKATDTVLGKAQESAESVKENAESVKRSMNTKNN